MCSVNITLCNTMNIVYFLTLYFAVDAVFVLGAVRIKKAGRRRISESSDF